MNNKFSLFKDGFEKRKLDKSGLTQLKKIKNKVKKIASKKLNILNPKIENIHNLKIKENFNDFRLDIIKKINNTPMIKEDLFKIFKKDLIKLFGEDIAVQKNINLAIQRPKDIDRASMHADAPSNSLFEIVIWLPLVDCEKTMNMFFFKINKTKKARKFLLSKKLNNADEFAKKNGYNPKKIKFGEYIIFWTKVYHYVPINNENKTRWSLNFRYKNIFSPYSQKGYLDFFEPINYSKLTNLILSNDD